MCYSDQCDIAVFDQFNFVNVNLLGTQDPKPYCYFCTIWMYKDHNFIRLTILSASVCKNELLKEQNNLLSGFTV